MISVNVLTVVNIIVSLIQTKILIEFLGLEVFGKYALLLSSVAILSTIGSSFTGALGRFLIIEESSVYRQKKSFYNATGGVTILLIITVLVVLFDSLLSSNSYFNFIYKFCFLLIFYLTQISALLGASYFVKEKFTMRSLIQALSKLAYIVGLYFFLKYFSFEKWSIIFGLTISTFILLFFNYKFFKSNFFKLSINDFVEFINIKEIIFFVKFIGWILLAYLGTYIIRIGTITIIDKNTTHILGEYAVAMQIDSFFTTLLTSISVLISPLIYKIIQKKRLDLVSFEIIRFFKIAIFISLSLLFFLYITIDEVVLLWLKDSVLFSYSSILLPLLGYALISCMSIPYSVFYAGIGKLKFYGVYSVIEAFFIILVHLVFSKYLDSYGLYVLYSINFSIMFMKNIIIIPFHMHKKHGISFRIPYLRYMFYISLLITSYIVLIKIDYSNIYLKYSILISFSIIVNLLFIRSELKNQENIREELI